MFRIHGSSSVRPVVALALGTAALLAMAPPIHAADTDQQINKSAENTSPEAAAVPLEEVTVTARAFAVTI